MKIEKSFKVKPDGYKVKPEGFGKRKFCAHFCAQAEMFAAATIFITIKPDYCEKIDFVISTHVVRYMLFNST